ncbi:MFS transporter [Streptococcus sp. X16XC17]|uniref:MFS transporter n=1 Tax=unclassified Streptococcus TaxID=2608887 RepID=UPI00066FC5FF|nr:MULTISPECIES: MFS transporter [unclassified Streptococcus]TCD45787.1 MFS transporter [Streptococcus sp. X16XC17]
MKNESWLKAAILSVSLFIMSHLAIAPAIPKLHALYQAQNANVSLASVETLVTIPAMMIMLSVILSNVIVTKLGKKKTVEVGLGLIFISGIISFLASNFMLAMIGRLILGIGIGLYNPLSISMISDYFEGAKRAGMIGLRTATMNVGKTLTTLIVGYALLVGPRYIFLVYVLVVPVLYLFHRFVKEIPVEEKRLSKVVIFDQGVFLWMLIIFFIGIAYIGATVKIPTLLVTHYGYDELAAGHLLTLLAFSGIIIGLCFGYLSKKMAELDTCCHAGYDGGGDLLFVFGNQVIFFYLGAVLIGASFVGGMSAIFDAIAKQYPNGQLTFVTSMAITAGNIGVILTPLILTKLVGALSLEPYVTPFYITTGLILTSLMLYAFLKKK